MPAWSDRDAVPLREYLAKNPNCLAELARRIPPGTKTETMEARALSAERREGWRDCIAELAKMSEHDEKPAPKEEFIDRHRVED